MLDTEIYESLLAEAGNGHLGHASVGKPVGEFNCNGLQHAVTAALFHFVKPAAKFESTNDRIGWCRFRA